MKYITKYKSPNYNSRNNSKIEANNNSLYCLEKYKRCYFLFM